MIDLHMHSHYSDDGEFTPETLAKECHRAGVKIMSVTDHNCAKANEEAAEAAARHGIRYVPGIELDCRFEGLDFHLLGYGIDSKSPDFRKIEEDIKARERETSQKRLEKIRELGFDVREEELKSLAEGRYWQETWTAEMFAQILLDRPEYADHSLLLPYRKGVARAENPYVNFYMDFCAQGRPCYVPMDFPRAEDAVRIIHRNGGLAVLAHPGKNLTGREKLLNGLVSLGLDGLEAYSSYHTEETAKSWAAAAQRHGLVSTCGSDYHGKTKPAISLLDYGCPVSQDSLAAEFLDRLEQAKKRLRGKREDSVGIHTDSNRSCIVSADLFSS